MRLRSPSMVTAVASAIAIALTLGIVPNPSPDPTPQTPLVRFEHQHALASASADKSRRLYDRWRQRHEAQGGDEAVRIALGPARAHRSALGEARGLATIDLVAGHAVVVAHGLDPAYPWDAWLVDNLPAPGASAALDPGDDARHLGRLVVEPGIGDAPVVLVAEGALSLDDGFEVDLVAVTRAGEPYADAVVISGMPQAFQRLYTRERQGRLTAYAEGDDRVIALADPPAASLARTLADALGTRAARAADTVVDADVVTDAMVAFGAELFVDETFDGNGRTCATCHPASNNFTLDPLFIAKLPPTDPLFVAERVPALATLEVSKLLRERALILENVDGFDRPGVLRSVPHTLAMSESLSPPTCVDPAGCDIAGIFTVPFGAYLNAIDGITSAASGFAPVSLDPFLEFPLERTGWSGDGAPGGGTLREFAIGAVVQHATLRLERVPGVDFRLPTDEELDALEIFQLSLGRSEDPDLRTMTFKDPVVARGFEIFSTNDTQGGTVQAGKCEVCHFNGGANSTPEVFGQILATAGVSSQFFSNSVFTTGVNDLAVDQTELTLPGVAPRDAGFGVTPQGAGDCITGRFDFSQGFPNFVPDDPPTPRGGFGTPGPPPFVPAGLCQELFNTPPLIEAADTPPVFHNNAFDTIEQAIAFYDSDAFNGEALNQLFIAGTDSAGIGIRLDPSSVNAIGKFLRVLNALENLRQSVELDEAALGAPSKDMRRQLLQRANDELEDAIEVLAPVKLHPVAIGHVQAALALNRVALAALLINAPWKPLVNQAVHRMQSARDDMVEP
ncbi:MAG: hypothetical protein IT385_13540 [Deltaproteobacteria bacterium]|nr:hypothetical protein [Deltaproteobacteria bacterium]